MKRANTGGRWAREPTFTGSASAFACLASRRMLLMTWNIIVAQSFFDSPNFTWRAFFCAAPPPPGFLGGRSGRERQRSEDRFKGESRTNARTPWNSVRHGTWCQVLCLRCETHQNSHLAEGQELSKGHALDWRAGK